MNRLVKRRLRFAAGAALAALVLAGFTLPSPAQAAGLSFGFGIGPRMYFGDDEGEDIGGACLSDYLLRKALEDQGYSRIRLNIGDEDHRMVVLAEKRGIEYRLVVNWCSGRIFERRLRGTPSY